MIGDKLLNQYFHKTYNAILLQNSLSNVSIRHGILYNLSSLLMIKATACCSSDKNSLIFSTLLGEKDLIFAQW